MISPIDTHEIIDRVHVVQLETDALARRIGMAISFGDVMQGLLVGLHAANNSDLNPNEVLDTSNYLEAFNGKDEEQLRGLFIGALMVPYVLGERGEQDV